MGDHKGAFLSFLDYLDRPGEVVRNLLSGNGEGAGRQLADILSGPLRAILPGDQSNWELSRPQDFVHGGDLAGIDRQAHPLEAMGADIGGDLLTDPLTYLSFGAAPALRALGAVGKTAEGVAAAGDVAKAAEVAATAGDAAKAAQTTNAAAEAGKNGGIALRVPFTKASTGYAFQGQALDPLSLIGRGLGAAKGLLPEEAQAGIDALALKGKSAFGWVKGTPAVETMLAQADALRKGVKSAKMAAAAKVLGNVAPDLAEKLPNLLDPAHPPGTALVPREDTFAAMPNQVADWQRRIAATDLPDAEKQTLSALAERYGAHVGGSWDEGQNDFAGFTKRPEQLPGESPVDYVPRLLDGQLSDSQRELLGNPAIAHSRTLTGVGDLGEFLAANPGVTRNTNLQDILEHHASQMGLLAERAHIGKALIGDQFKSMADADSVAKVRDAITAMKATDPESAMLLDAKFNGMKPQKGIEKWLAKSNQYFKQSAVAGAVLPKIGSITRNALSHPEQLAMSGMGDEALKQLVATPNAIWQGLKSSLEKYSGAKIGGDKISQSIDLMRQASENANGRFSNALKWLTEQGRPDLAEAMKNGIIDSGFVHSDTSPDLLKKLIVGVTTKLGAKPETVKRVLDAPGAGFSGSENYARQRTFESLLKSGVSPEEAAAKQREAFYDYGTRTPENRAFRTVVPFGSFTTGAIKQQAQGLSRYPAINDILNPLFGQSDTGAVPQFVAEQMRLPLGQGPDGNDHYLSGLAQPIEVLNDLPNVTGEGVHDLSRDLERSLVSASAPVLKSTYGVVTGKDPYFDTPYASYDRIPLLGNEGAAGRLYNAVAGTGFIQPVDALLHLLDHATDPRDSGLERTLGSLTGAHILNVDPQQAAIQNLRDELQGDVNAHPSSDFWSKDADTQALIKEYQKLQRAQAAKKKAATSHSG